MPEIKSQHQCVNLDDLKEAESFGEPIGAVSYTHLTLPTILLV